MLVLAVLAVLAPAASAVNNGIDGVDASLQAKAETQSRDIAKHLGLSLVKLHLAVGWARFQKDVPNMLTGTNERINGNIDKHGPICEIATNKAWFEPIPEYEKDEILAHEVFHCFEKEITPEAPTEDNWIEEGLARWVDLTLFPHTHLAIALDSLSSYYAHPEKSLFARSYDAVGFWAHVEDVDHDLWGRIPTIVRAGVYGRNQAALNAALAATDGEATFLSSWGSSAFDEQASGSPDWRMQSPLAGRYFPSPHQPEVVDGSSTFDLQPYSTTQLRIEPNAGEPLIEIHLDQAVHARFGVDTNYVGEAITGKTFCAAKAPSECTCPDGDSSSLPPLTELPSNPLLGAASDRIGGSVEITYLSMQASGYCKSPPPEALQSGRSCEGLLPGFSSEINPVLENVTGKHVGVVVSSEDGYLSYTCLLQFKGSLVEVDGEEVFRGVVAFAISVKTLPSIAQAQTEFQAEDSAEGATFPGGPVAGIADEAYLGNSAIEMNSKGESECGSIAIVRVRNVIAGFTLVGDPEEACGYHVLGLLQTVAGEL